MADGDPLFLAIEAGDPGEVVRWISAGSALDSRIDLADDDPVFRSLTPLMVAASAPGERAAILSALLDAGADPRDVNEVGVTALWLAAAGGVWPARQATRRDESPLLESPAGDFARRVEALLAAGLPAQEVGPEGRSALGEACSAGDAKRVRLLLDAGASPWPTELPASDPLAATERAPIEPKSTSGRRLVRGVRQVTSTGARSNAHQIPLFQAAESGSVECVRLILETGFPARFKDWAHRTALFFATTPDVARLLLDAGVFLNDKDLYYRTALESAVSNGAFDVMASVYVVTGGLNGKDGGTTPLQQAASVAQPGAIRALLHAGADPAATTDDGQTALHLAAWGMDTDSERTRETIRILADAGTPVDAKDAKGNTALHLSIAGDGPSPVATWELLQQGANPDTKNDAGVTPLMLAAEEGAADCMRILLAAGADLKIPDRRGKSALTYARGNLANWKAMTKATTLLRRKPSEATLAALRNANACVEMLSE